jgi:hypothetical protein
VTAVHDRGGDVDARRTTPYGGPTDPARVLSLAWSVSLRALKSSLIASLLDQRLAIELSSTLRYDSCYCFFTVVLPWHKV